MRKFLIASLVIFLLSFTITVQVFGAITYNGFNDIIKIDLKNNTVLTKAREQLTEINDPNYAYYIYYDSNIRNYNIFFIENPIGKTFYLTYWQIHFGHHYMTMNVSAPVHLKAYKFTGTGFVLLYDYPSISVFSGPQGLYDSATNTVTCEYAGTLSVYKDDSKTSFFFRPGMREIPEITTKTFQTMITGMIPYLAVFLVGLVAFWKGWQLLLTALHKA